MTTILKKAIKALALLMVIGMVIAVVAGGVFYYQISRDLPRIFTIDDYRPPTVTTLYSAEKQKIAEFYTERRIVVPLDRMPPMLINAFVAAEDARFFQHTGVDLTGVARAFMKNLEAGAIVQGGSTITQQVAKSFFLSSERTYTRKIREAILSYRIEKRFSKADILYLYLNQIYLGHGAYGVAAAAENYFGKPVEDLSLAECTLIAGLPQAPSRYSPYRYPARAKNRQLYVLNQMVTEGYISEAEAQAAREAELEILPVRSLFQENAPWYAEHVRRYVEATYGRDMLYNQGLSVYTAVDLSMQAAARCEVDRGLRDLDKRQGYRGPVRHLSEEAIEPFLSSLREEALGKMDLAVAEDIVRGVVVDVDDEKESVWVRLAHGAGEIPLEDMRWARRPDPDVAWYQPAASIKKPSQALKIGDVIWVRIVSLAESPENMAPAAEDRVLGTAVLRLSLEQEPAVEAALICMEARTGLVRAMIGGRDAAKSQFNRAVQAIRQPGSAFKPIIYAGALDKGYTPASVIIDSAIVFEDTARNFTWKPQNYEERFFGPTLFRRALEKSHNIPTIKILMDIGVDYIHDYAKKLGITSPLSRDLSIALGSSGLAPIELAKAYAVFANMGNRVEPVFITRIEDRDGRVLEENRAEPIPVIGSDTAYIMTHLLKGVVEHGTGRRARDLNRPAAGKTGTTDNLNDAWFVGYTPDYVTVVWVGFDEEQSLGKGETGASAASPIWLGFMQTILAGKPVKDFEVPEGVVFSRIDAETGLLATDDSRETFFECFKKGTEPTEYADPPDTVDEEAFFKGM
ncbi:MAG: PBP1A family penicillin-binding protein [Thermodesulfobacteriota bacterium]|nr:PBP1A family penicillin-binding protein [Thermodesulfobacteriota bacterium]